MKIMVVGGGGREHAIIKKIKENKEVTEIFAVPGNGGMAKDATLVNIGAKDIDKIVEFAKENNIGKIVLGHPINMNGTLGPRSEKARAFGERLRELTDIEVELFDERLSTANAHTILNITNTRGAKRKEIIDAMSASLILQSYLDREKGKING